MEVRNEILNYHEITDKIDEQFDLIIGEPHFSISLLPWHNLFYWYMLNSLTSKTISPVKATLWALPVKFCHLWKIRAPLHQVEGFDVKHFDDIILNACNVSDADVEPQPLWEYPNFALSTPKALMTFEFNKKLPQEVISRKVVFDGLETSEKGTGVVLFMDWNLTSKIVVTPLDPCFTIDSELQQSEDENSIKIDHHSVYHDTVRVKIKMVNKHMKPFTNATLNYVLGETAFGHRSMHPNHEDGDIEFHLPEDMLVHIATETLGPANGNHRGRPDPDNPTYFVAKDGLVLHLMFGGGSRYLPVTAKLRGDGFEISEGSLVRYVMKDWAGDEVNNILHMLTIKSIFILYAIFAITYKFIVSILLQNCRKSVEYNLPTMKGL